MDEAETVGMQTETVDGVVAVAVFEIAHDRTSDVLQVYADLIFAASLELHIQQSVVRVQYLEQIVMGDGEFAAVIGRTAMGVVKLVVGQIAPDRAAWRGGDTAGDGVIAPVGDNLAPMVGKGLLHLTALGVEQETGSHLVKAMDDMSGTLFTTALQILVKQGLEAEAVVSAGYTEHTYSLINDEEPLVLVDDMDKFLHIAGWAAGGAEDTALAADLDIRRGRHLIVKLCPRFAVYGHGAARQESLEPAAALVLVVLNEIV